ncbi:MAG: phage portal protein [Verrucomicrobiales bacterium]|jgi:hypothetical protein|nr:phage portal protein [Verrucomicrobiales bacterium]
MSRKKKFSKSRADGLALSAAASAFFIGGGGYQGAAWTNQRGYVYWPTLNPRREADKYSRLEIARRAHFLCANTGLAKRLINGVTNYVIGSGLVPRAETKDIEWNQLAEVSYYERARQAMTYDVSARLTATQAQRVMLATKYRDGDCAVVYSESQSGGALRAFYSGVQIGGGEDAGFVDGLKTDRLNRVQKFRLLDADGDAERARVISADNVRWLAKYDTPGQLRGISALAHAVNNLLDLTEISAANKQGIKTSAQVGYYIATAAQQSGGGGMVETMKRERQRANGGDNNTVSADKIFFHGTGGEIVELPAGRDLKTLLDSRPHPNSIEFMDAYLIRDIAWGFGISADLLWNISRLGGANTRWVLADAQVFIASEQTDLVDAWLAFDFPYHCAKEMAAGRLRRCRDWQWWSHSWLTPERITVDFGRDGNVILKKWQSFLISTSRVYGMLGQDARDEMSDELDFIAWQKEQMTKRGLTAADLQLSRGLKPAPAAADAEPPADDEDLPDKKINHKENEP